MGNRVHQYLAKKKLGITAPYTDTSHKENIALFLTQRARNWEFKKLKTAICYMQISYQTKKSGEM